VHPLQFSQCTWVQQVEALNTWGLLKTIIFIIISVGRFSLFCENHRFQILGHTLRITWIIFSKIPILKNHPAFQN